MGVIESTLGNAMQRMLMPEEVPDWYAGGRRKTAFPEGPANSLLLLGHVNFEVPDREVARQFYIDALQMGKPPVERKEPEGCIVVHAGASEFRLKGGSGGERVGGGDDKAPPPVGVWPGHFYCWVADIQKTWEACEALGAKLGCQLVEDVHHLTSDASIDVLVLQDPFGVNRFVVNQAPKGLVGKMRSLVSIVEGEGEPPNLLGIIEAMHLVPSGMSASVGRFYAHFLGAAVMKKEGGHAVHFSAGDALRQTLYFLEDESHPTGGEGGEKKETAATVPSTVCMYMPSEVKFKEAFQRCEEAGILHEHSGGWEAAAANAEFQVKRCVDPQTKSVVLDLEHTIRSPAHTECPVQAADPGPAVGA